MEVVEMVLAGSINKEIVALINAEGEWAIGLCGKDGNMVFAKKATKMWKDPGSSIERELDLGFVGEPVEVDRTLLDLLARSEMIPVIAPVAPGRDGATYNINADTFAGAIAGSLGAKRLLFLTDVDGVLDANKELIPELTVRDAKALIADGTISGGMIPKVETCLDALENRVKGFVIDTEAKVLDWERSFVIDEVELQSIVDVYGRERPGTGLRPTHAEQIGQTPGRNALIPG